MMIRTAAEIDHLLSRRINPTDMLEVNLWATENMRNKEYLLNLAKLRDDKIGINALWCLTHMRGHGLVWLQSLQNELIDMLLTKNHPGKERMLLQLLRNQSYSPETIRTDFLDYCFSKINSGYAPYAIRSSSIYCAFKMCRFYPELLAELDAHLNMLSHQKLSPGLSCSLRTSRKDIMKLRSSTHQVCIDNRDEITQEDKSGNSPGETDPEVT